MEIEETMEQKAEQSVDNAQKRQYQFTYAELHQIVIDLMGRVEVLEATQKPESFRPERPTPLPRSNWGA